MITWPSGQKKSTGRSGLLRESRPYPCRYVITSTKVAGGPQYTIDVRKWRTGADVGTDGVSLKLPAAAKQVTPDELADFDELPSIFGIKRGKGAK